MNPTGDPDPGPSGLVPQPPPGATSAPPVAEPPTEPPGEPSSEPPAEPASALAAPTPPPAPAFPVVGIGASAGGLEALKQFFQGVPAGCGMAFVVVQHLNPHHDGVLVELLQRGTSMPVQQIRDRMRVQPDHIYVIPPDRDLSILNGELLLLEPAEHHGLRLPIDHFFRSLAVDQRERAVGVILSGMGSDGTLGLRAIKETLGTVFVQEPASAKFDCMPRSAISAGLPDAVAPATQLAVRIIAYRKYAPDARKLSVAMVAPHDHQELEKVVAILRNQTGQDFSLYKKSTIYRRIERRMALHQLSKISDYIRYLRQFSDEGVLLFKELLIGVTRFFRDPEVWEQLKTQEIPALLAARPEGGTLRAWTPACSTGEEAYTLAMVFREALDALQPGVHYELQIFATDLDGDAINTARSGIYPTNIASDVSEARLSRFFVPENGGYRVGREVRDMVIFAPQNVVMDPPFTKLDLLTCRNLLIYLEADLQRKLLLLFHYSLKPHGILLLGNSETIGDASGLFATLPGKARLYRRRDVDASFSPDPVEFPPVFSRPRSGVAPTASTETPAMAKTPDLQLITNELLLQHFAPAGTLTTDKGDIVYICGKVGKYLEPAAGKASMNIFAMARNGLSGALNEVFSRAVRERSAITLKSLKIGPEGDSHLADVTVKYMTKPAALSGMVLVVFNEVTLVSGTQEVDGSQRDGAHDQRIAEMAADIQHVRDELKTSREEMQTSQEELKSTNEELQSTNEELQSTNEELTTSKEEMQSMNEELQSVNHELSAKVEEMSQSSDDMKNLLNSTAIATLFLDTQMRVRRFTTQATHIFKLIPSDVGRPITDLVTSLDYPALASDAQEVLRTLVFREVQVKGEEGHWFNVRTMPYRTQDDRIGGVVITFVDISVEKSLETSLRDALRVLQSAEPADDTGSDPSRLGASVASAVKVLEHALGPLHLQSFGA